MCLERVYVTINLSLGSNKYINTFYILLLVLNILYQRTSLPIINVRLVGEAILIGGFSDVEVFTQIPFLVQAPFIRQTNTSKQVIEFFIV